MKIDHHTLNALIAAAKQVGEPEVTVPYQDGTITIRFAPKPRPGAGAQMVMRLMRRHTLLFPGLRPLNSQPSTLN